MSRALAVVILSLYAAFEGLRAWAALSQVPPGMLSHELPTGYYAAVGFVGAVAFALSAIAVARAHPWSLGIVALALFTHTALLWIGSLSLWRSQDWSADLLARAGIALIRATPVVLLLLMPRLGRLLGKQQPLETKGQA